MNETPLLAEKRSRVGLMTLNRPGARNALSGEMLAILSERLESWRLDPEIYAVVLEARGGGVFCAGADLREVVRLAQEDTELARRFMAREYHYNYQLDTFNKPHVSLINGLVVGGGVGITHYGTHKVAGENYAFAMPEVTIGMIPDVGASRFLARMPGSTGLYLGLTGRRIGASDAYDLGLVTHVIEARHFADIKDALGKGMPVDQLLEDAHIDPGKGELKSLHGWIEAVFSASTLAEIFERAEKLDDESEGWSGKVLDELQQKSPTSLQLALNLWKKGKAMNFSAALQAEYGVVCNLLEGHDLFEGVRARLIDKDNAPSWQPAEIAQLDREAIDQLMQSSGERLELDPEKPVS